MKTRSYKFLIAVIVISITVFSCVPQRKFEEVKDKKERCEEERRRLKEKNESLTTANNEFDHIIDDLRKTNTALIRDTTIKGTSYRTLTVQYDKINELYQTLLENQERLRAGADAETRQALTLLEQTRAQLQAKEDDLRNLEARLNEERGNLEAMRVRLDMQESELEEKNQKVMELQAILDAQDAQMQTLRNTVANALKGFEGQGLTVSMKEGKVYVSLDEKLMFQSGRWDVDRNGQEALKSLANVLEQNPDINIMIEGHTDDLPYRGSGNIEDNWDLSVKRATAIVKILLNNSNIDPTRLTAAGRGEFLPVDPARTAEARARNRRTEIILTPRLDILYEIMETKE